MSKNIDQNLNEKNLFEAIISGNQELALSIIDKGVDLNAKDQHSATPLMFACKGGHLEVVIALIRRGASLDVKDIYSFNAEMYARDNRREEVVKLLQELAAETDDSETEEDTSGQEEPPEEVSIIGGIDFAGCEGRTTGGIDPE